jgi:hypothetical protein
MHDSQRTTRQFQRDALSKPSRDSLMGREAKANAAHLFATGHLKVPSALSTKSKMKWITNVSTPCHLIQQALRKISATDQADVAYLL